MHWPPGKSTKGSLVPKGKYAKVAFVLSCQKRANSLPGERQLWLGLFLFSPTGGGEGRPEASTKIARRARGQRKGQSVVAALDSTGSSRNNRDEDSRTIWLTEQRGTTHDRQLSQVELITWGSRANHVALRRYLMDSVSMSDVARTFVCDLNFPLLD